MINTNTDTSHPVELPIQQNTNGYLQDSNGDKSSKRLWGSILLVIGILMGLGLFGYGLYSPSALYASSYNVFQTFIMSGSALLGLGLLENFKGVFGRSNNG